MNVSVPQRHVRFSSEAFGSLFMALERTISLRACCGVPPRLSSSLHEYESANTTSSILNECAERVKMSSSRMHSKVTDRGRSQKIKSCTQHPSGIHHLAPRSTACGLVRSRCYDIHTLSVNAASGAHCLRHKAKRQAISPSTQPAWKRQFG